MSLHLRRQIDKLKEMILALGTLAEESVEGAIRAFETRDPILAQQVIDKDSEIDLMELEVEEECLHTLALHQPVAFDLRYVVAVLKINNDLERIADLAGSIAENVAFLARASGGGAGGASGKTLGDLPLMSRRVRVMLKQSLDAMVNLDPALAEQVRNNDDEVDEMHSQMYLNVKQAIRQSPQEVEVLLNLLNVSRILERIADHTVNIADDVIYMVKGDILRHSRPHPLQRDKKSPA
jgi:phosphate transport system protein